MALTRWSKDNLPAVCNGIFRLYKILQQPCNFLHGEYRAVHAHQLLAQVAAPALAQAAVHASFESAPQRRFFLLQVYNTT